MAWDVSAFVGSWPFRRLPHATPKALEERLRREGIQRALVSPLETLFDNDPHPACRLWSEALKGHSFFRLVPVLNPTLPGWERRWEAYREEGAVAVRLLPNYHGYSAAEGRAQALLRAAGAAGMAVFIQIRMQDVRSMHPLCRVPDVPWREVLALARSSPEAPLVVAAAKWHEAQELLQVAEELPGLHLEISHLEHVDGLRRLVEQWGAQRLLLGTHAPLFTPTAARWKVEAAELAEADRWALLRGYAERLLGGTP